MFHFSLCHFTFYAELRDTLKNFMLSVWEGIDRGDDEKGRALVTIGAFWAARTMHWERPSQGNCDPCRHTNKSSMAIRPTEWSDVTQILPSGSAAIVFTIQTLRKVTFFSLLHPSFCPPTHHVLYLQRYIFNLCNNF